MRYDPRSWGRTAITFGLQNANCALWADPGMGKTGITLAIVMLLLQRKLIKGTLVVAPLNVVYNVWPKECAKWDQFQSLKISVLHGPKKENALSDKADIYLINYEGLPWLAKTLNTKRMWSKDKLPFDMIVLDESSKTKNPSSQRFKLLKAMIQHFRRCLELTGTPAPNGLRDVWSQVYLLDGGRSLGRSKTAFYTQYFDQTGYGGYTLLLKPGASEEIYNAIHHLIHRMDAADYLDLPELLTNDILVDLPPTAMAQYRKLEKGLLLKLGDKTITPINTAAALNKCQQFAGGSVYEDDGVAWQAVHDAKLDALSDLIDELGGKPLLVGYWFRPELHRLVARFNAPDVDFLHGERSPKDVTKILERWNNGDLRVLFAQIQSAAHGLNLQSGPGANVCYYAIPYDAEAVEQFYRRLYRQGQSQRVTVHRLLSRRTVDEDVVRTWSDKTITQKDLLDAMKARNGEATDSD